ncbi:MAG TPA: hypothetical protein VJ809_04680 [Pirellulales bacterium]|jgi:hypothetical protein|nr:hypothetical protein [Pirellulales bacterium]
MSEPDRQERIADTLSLLSQMIPAALAANRDELFFRAGEASGRRERRESSRAHRVMWPTAAAALALIAAGLATALVTREPEVRVVHVERPIHADHGQASSVAKAATPHDGHEREPVAMEPAASVFAANEHRHRISGDGIIYSQDWAALSDAFRGQLRMQQERSQRTREATLSATVEDSGSDAFDGAPSRQKSQSYLELRDAMQAL